MARIELDNVLTYLGIQSLRGRIYEVKLLERIQSVSGSDPNHETGEFIKKLEGDLQKLKEQKSRVFSES